MSLRVHLPEQWLELVHADGQVTRYPVSTAANGPGEEDGSGCTPRGRHYVRAKVGAGQPLGAVFVGRRPTGEIYTPELARAHPARDWILTRILWLRGREPGRNRLGTVDSFRRYIYIHGTPDSEPMGEPRSHGCIRMRNADVLELFDQVPVGTEVEIID
ncbi:MAG: L,D-transpeptidase [Gammaproteobacteria bacterium]|nr:L,D-transpeptidase [Gammaproteobacteria bacterium]